MSDQGVTATIRQLLADLAVIRPVFHSEADFQHGLAWLIHERLWVTDEGEQTAIELKFLGRSLKVTIAGEGYHLLSQGAQDL